MKKIISFIISAIMCVTMLPATAVFAAEAGSPCKCPGDPEEQSKWTGKTTVDTSILSACDCPSIEGGSIGYILNLVVDIMTIGIGILGVIGISVVGIQYLTAGGSEEKTRKAKRRMFEIIIGLVAYAVIYALLKFLNIQPESEQSSFIIVKELFFS